MRFQWKYIDISLLNGSLPNIICNHARYNGDVMDNIMTPGTVYVTMLRNPATQLETTFHNLRFADLLGIEDSDDPLGTFITNPKVYIQNVIKQKKFKVRIFNLLTRNNDCQLVVRIVLAAQVHSLVPQFSLIEL